jgi:transcriptional regulator with XRE-family HTH domain
VITTPALRRVGSYLKDIREERKRHAMNPREHSIQAYAEKIGWPISKLQQIENSRKHMVDPWELQALATAYDVPYSKLVEKAGFLEPLENPSHEEATT